MKHLLLAATILAAFIPAAANAADLGEPAAPVPAFAPAAMAPQGGGSWNGFYAGGSLGFNIASSAKPRISTEITTGLTTSAYDLAGTDQMTARTKYSFNATINGGYNYQVGRTIVGAEADLAYIGLHRRGFYTATGTSTLLGNTSADASSLFRSDWVGSLRGRVGYLMMPNVMVYGTAGVAFTHVSQRASANYSASALTSPYNTDTMGGRKSRNLAGYVVGAGVEYELTPSLTARVEYLYTDFGRQKVAIAGVNSKGSTSMPVDFHTVKAGFNYRFQ